MFARTPLGRVMLATTALVPFGIAAALANPLGPNVVGGGATVSGVGTSNVTINQTTPRAIINWHTFNIGAGETTRFIQPSASAVALNRVIGNIGPSMINGVLTANGQVYLVNPNGVLIGKGGVVNTAGFLATTFDITNDNFMAGRYKFDIPGNPSASIVNEGRINAHSQGFAALVAPGVRNSGTIVANYGTIGLASSGNGFSLDFYGDRLIALAVGDQVAATVRDVATGEPLTALVKNEGKLKANGGRVELTAASARTVVDAVINNTGVIEARTVGTKNGKIVLGGPTAETKVAGLPAQTVRVSGKLDVSAKRAGGKGGTIEVTGERIVVQAASFDASGPAGGGKVLIGGDTGGGANHWAAASIPQAGLEATAIPNATSVSVDAATVINASATSVGNGGKVIIWADGDTTFAGTILAKGGATSGDGGFVEVSGKQTLAYLGTSDLRALHGSFGTLLLDPGNLTIDNGTGTTFVGNNLSDSTLGASVLENALSSANVVVQTGSAVGDILVNANFTWGGTTSLTLRAYGNITFDAPVVVTHTGTGKFILQADMTGTGAGRVNFNATFGSQIVSNGGGQIHAYYNPFVFNTQDFNTARVALSGGSTLTTYMLVNNLINLQAMTGSGNYALGNSNITGTFNGLTGPFNGIFDGLNNTISGLVVNGPSMFGINAGTIRDLTLDGITINATGNNQFLGVVAGLNQIAGNISNVTVSNSSINGGAFSGTIAGLLVGQNSGTIAGSYTQGNVTVGDGIAMASNFAGGLVGVNVGTITQSNADVTVVAGNFAFGGGLAAMNGGPSITSALIDLSSAEGTVTSAGDVVLLGGLVGLNGPGALIRDSNAVGNVTASGSVPPTNCSPDCKVVVAGGLVGENRGTISSVQAPYMTFAQGDVHVGSNAVGGGLVGVSYGWITLAEAFGNVTGDPGMPLTPSNFDKVTTLGGLVGVNRGVIELSNASGDVGTIGVERLEVGGLVGLNSGSISTSTASGNVRAGNYSQAGGFAGTGEANCDFCSMIPSDGSMAYNTNSIIAAMSDGTVTVGDSSLAGGFIGGSGVGSITLASATGSVTGGTHSILGGFAGAIDFGSVVGIGIASGTVTATGPFSWVGGFVGYNAGTVGVSAVNGGAVVATSESIVGGFAAVNIGSITAMSMTDGTITATNNNVIGGFAGANFGLLNNVQASGTITPGSNNIIGTLIGANAHFVNFPPGLVPFSSFPTGTFSNYTASGTVNSAPNNTVGDPVGIHFPTQLPTYPNILASCSETMCAVFNDGILGRPTSSDQQQEVVIPPSVQAPPDFRNSPINPQLPDVIINLASLMQNLPLPGGGPGPRGITGPQPGAILRSLAPLLPQRPTCGVGGQCTSFATLLPPGQFVPNQVVVQIPQNTPPQVLQQIMQQLGLTVLGTAGLTNGNNALNLQLPPGVSIADVIRQLEQNQVVAIAQANMTYGLVQQVPAAIAPFTASRGDPAQYSMGKLQLNEAHRVASGSNIIVAVIDSEVDAEHVELKGTISQTYDATETQARAHSHGTAMAGAIVSRDRLLGVAPGARILAIRAFSETQTSAESTTFTILKGIEYAVNQGARVINMSFAGPYDPSLERALKDAAGRGIVLIGASGNAGPKSPPLWPGADPNVIAVTATDSGDRVFRQANRGPYISVASPGVEILAPAPQSGYQMSTGTSIATAHVSGVVALMLERDPSLTPQDVRLILESTANDLGPRGKDQQFGWGMVNPAKALAMVDERKRQKTGGAPAPARQR